MPTFETLEPIVVQLSLGLVAANVRVSAHDRKVTTVEVGPADPSSKSDVRIAEQTRVEYADGRLEVTAPKRGSLFGRSGSLEVTISLPSRSRLHGEIGMGDLLCEGRLGECRFKTGLGQIRLDAAGPVTLNSGMGDITVEHAEGDAEITAGSGAVSLRRIDGSATVKNSNGASWLGEVAGGVRVKAANGSISVDRAHAGVTAKTANGSVRIGEVARGAVTLETSAGSVEVGIRSGTAAWLDLKTTAGRVRNELTAAAGPDDTDEKVEVRARTHVGDVVIHRT